MRRVRLSIASIVLLGLVSCSSGTPFEPLVQRLHYSPLPAPTPPTPATASGPVDSLLEANRSLWSASGIDSYRYRFRWECFCGTDYNRVVDIIVVDDAVVSVFDASTGYPLNEALAHYRTIDGLFDLVRTAIDSPEGSVSAVYDANLGYPTDTFIDYIPAAIDDELRFRIFGLSPLPGTTGHAPRP